MSLSWLIYHEPYRGIIVSSEVKASTWDVRIRGDLLRIGETQGPGYR